jgi:hypothetical protein
MTAGGYMMWALLSLPLLAPAAFLSWVAVDSWQIAERAHGEDLTPAERLCSFRGIDCDGVLGRRYSCWTCAAACMALA